MRINTDVRIGMRLTKYTLDKASALSRTDSSFFLIRSFTSSVESASAYVIRIINSPTPLYSSLNRGAVEVKQGRLTG